MKILQYNYVFFNSINETNPNRLKDNYYYICAADLANNNQTQLVSFPLDYAPFVIRKAFFIHRSKKLNKLFNLPLKRLWYPFYFNNKFNDSKNLCFVISDRVIIDLPYIKWLKHKYPEAKFVIIYRDLMKFCSHYKSELIGNPIFDLAMSYDEGECKEYGMIYFDEFESKIDVPIAKEYPLSDFFFAGLAKERLPILRSIYDKAVKVGLKPHYYITGVPTEQQESLAGITYASSNMSYYDMLYYTINSKCVLEINQDGATGYTSRFIEAVMYNKKLITNNHYVRESKFYDPRFIQIIDKAEDIDFDFIKDDSTKVDYHYENEFSPLRMIETIDEELIRRYGK